MLEARVSADGKVTAAQVVTSVHTLLDEAARKALLQYEYTPGLQNGVPAAFRLKITVRLTLQ